MKRSQAQLVQQLTSKQLKLQVWFSQGFLFIVAITLAFFLFEEWGEILDLFNWNVKDIILLGILPSLIIIGLDLLMMQHLPSHLWDDGGINEKIFREGSYRGIFILCLVIAMVEELLFRGVIQSNWGIIVASIIFALVHIRYLSKILLFLSVVLLSFLFGIIFEWSNQNLFVVITMHFIVDFVLAIYIRAGRAHNGSRKIRRPSS